MIEKFKKSMMNLSWELSEAAYLIRHLKYLLRICIKLEKK